MSLPIILFIMLFAGIIGGIISFLLPANLNTTTNTRIQPLLNCILIGIGATILIPLFLEIAQSNLLNNIHNSWILEPLPIPLKSYLLFGAYCFLAAAAGPRFINNLIDGVLKDKQIANLVKENKIVKIEKDKAIVDKEKAIIEKQEVTVVKDKVEKVKDKLIAQNQILAKEEENAALNETKLRFNTSIASVDPEIPLLPKIGPITDKDDPQKGRFGGLSEKNGRALKAEVKQSSDDKDYFEVRLWVESTDPQKPLKSDVVFYLHDSFRPSVYTLKQNEFTEGKAEYDDILAYGAFTVGAVTDNGQTLLELDLAQQEEFPKTFRNR